MKIYLVTFILLLIIANTIFAKTVIVTSSESDGPGSFVQIIQELNQNYRGVNKIILNVNEPIKIAEAIRIENPLIIEGNGATLVAVGGEDANYKFNNNAIFELLPEFGASGGHCIKNIAIITDVINEKLALTGIAVYSSFNSIENCSIGVDWKGNAGESFLANAIVVRHSRNNIIRNTIVSGNKICGIKLESANNNYIIGNIIGLCPNRNKRAANHDGIQLIDSSYNVIGLPEEGFGNIISGNTRNGILLRQFSSNNEIMNNLIGINDKGETYGNKNGIFIFSGPENEIGGQQSTWQKNIIAGNKNSAIYVGHEQKQIKANYIGSDKNNAIDGDENIDIDKSDFKSKFKLNFNGDKKTISGAGPDYRMPLIYYQNENQYSTTHNIPGPFKVWMYIYDMGKGSAPGNQGEMIKAAKKKVYYIVDDGKDQKVADFEEINELVNDKKYNYCAQIPDMPNGTKVQYFIEIEDSNGHKIYEPSRGIYPQYNNYNTYTIYNKKLETTFTLDNTIISPNGDGVLDQAKVSYLFQKPDKIIPSINIQIKNEFNEIVDQWEVSDKKNDEKLLPPDNYILWQNEEWRDLDEGQYTVHGALNLRGAISDWKKEIVVDLTAPEIAKVKYKVKKNIVVLDISVIESYCNEIRLKAEFMNGEQHIIKIKEYNVNPGEVKEIKFVWDGMLETGKAANQGNYTGFFSLVDKVGNTTSEYAMPEVIIKKEKNLNVFVPTKTMDLNISTYYRINKRKINTKEVKNKIGMISTVNRKNEIEGYDRENPFGHLNENVQMCYEKMRDWRKEDLKKALGDKDRLTRIVAFLMLKRFCEVGIFDYKYYSVLVGPEENWDDLFEGIIVDLNNSGFRDDNSLLLNLISNESFVVKMIDYFKKNNPIYYKDPEMRIKLIDFIGDVRVVEYTEQVICLLKPLTLDKDEKVRKSVKGKLQWLRRVIAKKSQLDQIGKDEYIGCFLENTPYGFEEQKDALEKSYYLKDISPEMLETKLNSDDYQERLIAYIALLFNNKSKKKIFVTHSRKENWEPIIKKLIVDLNIAIKQEKGAWFPIYTAVTTIYLKALDEKLIEYFEKNSLKDIKDPELKEELANVIKENAKDNKKLVIRTIQIIKPLTNDTNEDVQYRAKQYIEELSGL